MNRPRFWFLASLILLAAASRLVPHPPGVSPLAAAALFGGATIERRWLALLVPLASLFVSDLLLQSTYLAGWQPHWGFYPGQEAVYASFMGTASLGFLLRRRRRSYTVAAASVASSLLFFVVTNFAVWTSGLMYPRTAAGLWLCYALAVPFLSNSLIGDLAFSVVLFGALAVAEARVPLLRPKVLESIRSPSAARV
jgi:hypothetical protein